MRCSSFAAFCSFEMRAKILRMHAALGNRSLYGAMCFIARRARSESGNEFRHSGLPDGALGRTNMNKLILPAAVAAFALSLGSASAQTETQSTTTVQSSPDTQTTTTTTERNDGYGTYRKTVTSTKRYDVGTFVAPSGYTYSRYSIGERVPHVLISTPNLVLGDYSSYRLDSP